MSVRPDAHDLQRHYSDQVQQIAAQYDQRLTQQASTLAHAIRHFAADEPLRTIRRGGSDADQSVQAFVTQRIDELLRAAVHDEREKTLKDTLQKLGESQTRVKELERNQQTGAAATFELTHRSALTHTHSTSHIARLDSQLKDALRDVDIARQSEMVYRDQVQALQNHAMTASRKLETLLKEHAALQLQKQHASEQLSLAEAHAKEAELMLQLVEKKAKARLAAREKELQDELANMKTELHRAQKDARRTLEQQLRELKSSSEHAGLVALNEMKLDCERRIKQKEEEHAGKCERYERSKREAERNTAEEIRRIQVLYGEERNSLVESHRQQLDSLRASHAQELTNLHQSHSLALSQSEDRIAHLLHRHSIVSEEKERVVSESEREKRHGERQQEERVTELQVLNKSLQDKVTSLGHQLAVVTAVKNQMDTATMNHADEIRTVQGRYAELATRYQNLTQQHQQAQLLLQSLTTERDELKSKYQNLGQRMESAVSVVETGLAQTVSDEKEKRRQVKLEYEQQRQKWKAEKHAMLETISLQERKLIDLKNISEGTEEKAKEVTKHEEQVRKDFEEERRAAQSTIAQLQQDVQTLQSHRKATEQQLAEKIFLIEKLLLEKTHVVDFQQQATTSVNQQKDHRILTLESEFNLRSEKLRHELEQYKKDLQVEVHAAKMQSEREKQEMWLEAQKQMDAKLAQLRSSLFTPEQVEAKLQREVEARVVEQAKSLMYPHQHEAIVASKVDAARAKLLLDHELALGELKKRSEESLDAAEQRHLLRQEELKLRYESEYTKHSEALKQAVEDAEERTRKARTQLNEATIHTTKLESELREAKAQLQDVSHRLESKSHDDARFLSHISAQSGVISKLQELVDTEKLRVAALPEIERRAIEQRMEQERKATEARMQEERRAMEARMEEARQRWNAERQLLIQTHQEQLATLQSMREADAHMLSQLNLQREAREKEHLSREDALLSSHRSALSSASQRHASSLAAVESQHSVLVRQKEAAWSQEVQAREELLEKKVASWEEAYKNELATRERKVNQLTNELRQMRERKEQLEMEAEQLQRQLNDTASVLENQSAKLARTGTQIRAVENGY